MIGDHVWVGFMSVQLPRTSLQHGHGIWSTASLLHHIIYLQQDLSAAKLGCLGLCQIALHVRSCHETQKASSGSMACYPEA